MKTITRQKVRVARWRILEAFRQNVAARFFLGSARLARGASRALLRRRYEALEDLCAVRRVARIGVLDQPSRGLERALLRRAGLDGSGPPPMAENPLLREFLASREAQAIGASDGQDRFARITLTGDLILLKEPDLSTGELGVILLKYSTSFPVFAALYDLARVVRDYQIVLEPSWIGYVDPVFYLYACSERRIVVEAHQREDHDHVAGLGLNLVPVATGSSYWVDDATFHPIEEEEKTYAAIMVAHWGPLKRHGVILDALARLEDKSVRLAFVGYPWGGCGKEWIVDLVQRLGLEGQVDFYEALEPTAVNELFNRSCANLLLSRKEGGNKAIYEGMLAGTPCIVSDAHRGIRLSDVNERTGMRVLDRDLPAALRTMMTSRNRFQPRAWALEHACYRSAHALVERTLEDCAKRDGRPWTRGIAAKVNRPNLAYRFESDTTRLRPFYDDLEGYLRPVTRR